MFYLALQFIFWIGFVTFLTNKRGRDYLPHRYRYSNIVLWSILIISSASLLLDNKQRLCVLAP